MAMYAPVPTFSMGSPGDMESTSCTNGCTYVDQIRVPRASDKCIKQSCPSTNRKIRRYKTLRESSTSVQSYDINTKGMTSQLASNIKYQFLHRIDGSISKDRRVDAQTQLPNAKWDNIAMNTKQQNHKSNNKNISYNRDEPDDWITVISKRNKKTGHG
jgi:hypothetical protein